MTAILTPLFVQVGLTIIIYLLLASTRIISAARDAEVQRKAALGEKSMFGRTPSLLADSLTNQFELPVLFYVAVLLAVVTGPVPDILVTLAWIFVATRAVHFLVHVTINQVLLRFASFFIGFVTIIIMWWTLFQKLFAA